MTTENTSPAEAEAELAEKRSFRRAFWYAYAAHFAMTLASTMFYRLADFVKIIGGTDVDLGYIVGVGVVGGLSMRAFQAVASDAYGPRPIWIASGIAVSFSFFAHLLTPVGWLILYFPLRLIFQAGLNGFFGSSITYMSGRAPIARMAEVVGNLGTAGFIGMVAGPLILDQILGKDTVSPGEMNVALLIGAVSAAMAAFFSAWGTKDRPRARRQRHPPLLAVVRRYHPGCGLLVAGATGFGLSLPTVYLRPFLEGKDIAGIATFFVMYPVVAFITRLSIRRFPERFGVRPLILIGMAFLVTGSASHLLVSREWHVTLPAALLGVAHAVLFPAVIARGTMGFPLRFRGVGTSIILGAFDFGSLVGMPAASTVLYFAEMWQWPVYPTLFIAVTIAFTAIAVLYWMFDRPDGETQRRIRKSE